MLDRIDTAAILDMKWLHPSASCLSVATADAAVTLYKYDEASASLRDPRRIDMNTTQSLCLSLDWSDRVGGVIGGYGSHSNVPAGIVSQSDGTIAHIGDLERALQGDKQAIDTWHAHDYEAWITAYDCWSSGTVVWSGGDDLCLKGWDLRTSHRSDTSASSSEDGSSLGREPLFRHQRSFEGGVTSLQSHHLVPHLWAVGRYVRLLAIFDVFTLCTAVTMRMCDYLMHASQ